MKPTHIAVVAIVTLLVADFFAGIGKRTEFPYVVEEFHGVWQDLENEISIKILDNSLVISSSEWSNSYRVKESMYFQDGSLFLSNLFGERKFAIVCDRESTLRNLKSSDLRPPQDYNKTFYFSKPDEIGDVAIAELTYMSQGHEGSEGIYEWKIGNFSRQ